MGESVTLFDALLISVSSMTIVFAVLYVISLILGLFKTVFYKEEAQDKKEEKKASSNMDMIEEEDRLLIALAASALASNNRNNTNFRVKSIRRVQ